ncbi:NACHT domain-containing protein [Streptomyces fulvoviolaceus]|uniref:NACHT domain-containing protein n=1 Tax=Streptomyces fulvoviolaceus TaxID=285535 RepID=UPI0004CBBA61|nr:NACHT domain-containing protein [Streptomyces fulvoviolaceus]
MSGQIDKLLPYGIGGVAALAFLLFVARPYFTTLAGDAAKATPGAAGRLYRRLRPVGGRKLQRYRNQVRAENSKVRLGLSQASGSSGQAAPGLRDVYVPLQCEVDGGRGDATALLRAHHRTMLLGAPGAGKSLLLKHELLNWAEGKDDRELPVIVHLHTCNTAQEPFEELIARRFENAGISKARAADMLRTRLETGGLRVFFDGLDEVGTDHFERVVRELRDFAVHYTECTMVVSCRTAAYEQQLQDVFHQEVHVAEFDDVSILRFLSKWPDLKDQVTAARIFQALQEDPELKVLARSPLMLTMIAYLQSGDRPESVGPLPNSRASFYEMAVAHLLDRDRLLNRSEAIGTYRAGRKTLVLQRLALAQLSASSARGDRQEITRAQFETVIEALLPGFDLERSPHLQGMLNEIVARSELLKDIDRGRHYQFTHLTLLEYLAACELRTDGQQLMEHYRRAPQPWRETVRMWCAVTHLDCTPVVREVFEDTDMWRKVLALQCLADAVHIEESLAEEILTFFLERLGTPGDTEGDVAKGFGALAASSGLRGRRVREALIGTARGPLTPRRSAAVRALIVSGRQEAAATLAQLEDDEARAALQAMGDVAVPALARAAERGETWAVRSLGAVGTPAAALRLAGLLWTGADGFRPAFASDTASAAAWHLAALMRNPDVRNALTDFVLPPNASQHDQHLWIGEAFRPTGVLQALAARAAWLMDHGALDAAGEVPGIHPYIGIPLFACAPFGTPPSGDDQEAWQEIADGIRGSSRSNMRFYMQPDPVSDHSLRLALHRLWREEEAATETGRSLLEPLRDVLLERFGVAGPQRAALRALPWHVQAKLLSVRFGGNHVKWSNMAGSDQTRWRTINEQVEPPRVFSALAWATGLPLLGLDIGLGATRLLSRVFGWHPGGMALWGPSWLAITVGSVIVLAVAGLFGGIWIDDRSSMDSDVGEYMMLTSFFVAMAGVTYLCFLGLVSGRDLFGWPVTLAVTGTLAALTTAAIFAVAHIDSKINNPLRLIALEAHAAP